MKTIRDRECVIELLWGQSAPGEWTAVLTDRNTGARYEARSLSELEVALREALRQPR